jgi:hypothetical protein
MYERKPLSDVSISPVLNYKSARGTEPSKLTVNLDPVTGVALLYHGYRRTGSLLWGIVYGLAGYKVPIVAVPVAMAQGFGKKKICTTE